MVYVELNGDVQSNGTTERFTGKILTLPNVS